MRTPIAAPAVVRSCALFVALLAACGAPPYHDVVGPYTGATYRFAVDQIILPMRHSDYPADLNGEGFPHNAFGNLCGGLAGQADLADAVPDLLASGALAPFVEITSDDPALRDDPTVGVRFVGGDDTSGEMGALLVDGVLGSNPDALTQDPISATLHVPLFPHADPLILPAIGLEILLRSDGNGSFSGELHGAFPADADVAPAYASFAQMIAANPQEFPNLWKILDTNQIGRAHV